MSFSVMWEGWHLAADIWNPAQRVFLVGYLSRIVGQRIEDESMAGGTGRMK